MTAKHTKFTLIFKKLRIKINFVAFHNVKGQVVWRISNEIQDRLQLCYAYPKTRQCFQIGAPEKRQVSRLEHQKNVNGFQIGALQKRQWFPDWSTAKTSMVSKGKHYLKLFEAILQNSVLSWRFLRHIVYSFIRWNSDIKWFSDKIVT